MRKIKVLALVMVLSFAALGGAYAMFYDSVSMNATIKTGTLEVHWVDIKSSDSGGYYACMDGGPGNNVYQGSRDNAGSGIDEKNIGSLNATPNNSQKPDLLEINLANGYPGYQEYVEAGIKNVGTMPVKIHLKAENIPCWLEVKTELPERGKTGEGFRALEGEQLDPDDTVKVKITYTVSANAPKSAQYNHTKFDVQVHAVQWNAYSENGSYSLKYSIVKDRIDDNFTP